MTKDLDKKVAHAMELQYERGFIDGMQKQMQSSVDKAVNAMSQTQEPVACAECERLKDALKRANGLAEHFERAWYLRGDEIELLKAQTQEPWCMKMNDCKTKCKDCPDEPPQRTWVDLTDEEIDNINYTSAHMLAREVLAKFKEKNT